MDKKKFILNFAYYACFIVIRALFYKYLLPVMMPFIIGFIFAVIVNALLKKKRSRMGRVVTLSAIYLVLVVLITFLGANIIQAIAGIDYTALYTDTIAPLMKNVYGSIQTLIRSMPPKTQSALISSMETITRETDRILLSISGSAVTMAAGIITSIPKLFLSTMIAMIASYYIALDYENVVSALDKLTPQKLKYIVNEIIVFTKEKVVKFILAYSKLMLLNFTECVIGFTLLKVDNVILIALITTIVDVLPVLGTGTILIPWAIVSFFTNKIRGIALLVMYLIITVIRNAVEPKVVGTSINLNPLLTFICLVTGLQLAGITGIFLFPMIAAFIIYIKEKNPDIFKHLFDI